MNNRKPYMAPATTLYHIEASTMLCGSGGGSNVTETEVRPGEYAPDPPQNSCGMMSDGGYWDAEE